MTPTEINIRIAEACGWTDIIDHHGFWLGIPPGTNGISRTDLPSYATDLNAIHKAEKTLTDDDLNEKYCQILCDTGFLNNKDEYLSREEAWAVAERAGQIIRSVGPDGILYSENLY